MPTLQQTRSDIDEKTDLEIVIYGYVKASTHSRHWFPPPYFFKTSMRQKHQNVLHDEFSLVRFASVSNSSVGLAPWVEAEERRADRSLLSRSHTGVPRPSQGGRFDKDNVTINYEMSAHNTIES